MYDVVDHVLAQVNIARLREPMDSPRLAGYVYSEAHRQVLRRRRAWFERMAEAHLALWWIPRGHIPTTREAEDRVLHLREFGPTPHAFTLREYFPPPGAGAGLEIPGSTPVRSPEEWTCPA
jgi:hypothetical protein